MVQPPVEVKIKGIKQLNAGAARLFENIEHAEATDAVRPTAEQVAAIVRSRVPRKTGALAASVHVAQRGQVAQVQMGAGLVYARWIEFAPWGRRTTSPRQGRFVYPTAKRTTRAFRKHAELVAGQQIKRMRWPQPR